MARRTAVRGGALSLAVVLAACGGGRDGRAITQSIQADIAFGSTSTTAAPAAAPPATPGTAPATIGQAAVQAPLQEVPAFNPVMTSATTRPPRATRPGAVTAPVAPCPAAPLGSAPEREAGVMVAGVPQEGRATWITEIEALDGTNKGTHLTGSFTRAVRNVKKTGDTTTFEVVSLLPTQRVITSYQVLPNATSVSQQGVRVGQPDRGISLTSQVVQDRAGTELSRVTLSPPLLLLPLPVLAGEAFRVASVDARSGGPLVYDAQVVKRQTVDACGTLVDCWLVKGTLTAGTVPSRPVEYGFATALGGLPVYETDQAVVSGVTYAQRLHLGQATPSALKPEDDQ